MVQIKINIYPALMFLIILIQSCSSIDNRAAIAKSNLENMIAEQSSGYLKLDYFEKSDAKEMNIGGMNGYILEFNATVIFLSDASKTDDSWANNFRVMSQANQGSLLGLMAGYPKLYHKGDNVQLKGNVIFEKKESGWSVVRIEVLRITSSRQNSSNNDNRD